MGKTDHSRTEIKCSTIAIAVANDVFGPLADEIAWARRITEAWTASVADGKGVTLVDRIAALEAETS